MSSTSPLLRPIPFPTAPRSAQQPGRAGVRAAAHRRSSSRRSCSASTSSPSVLTNDWTRYLATEFNDLIPGSAADAMYMVGGVEILAGLVVAVAPRFGGLLVAGWLGGIIVNLLLVGGYGDIALRDFGLLIGALALSRLAAAHDRPGSV